MLDMKFVRENLPAVQEMLQHRCNTLDLSPQYMYVTFD